MRLQKKRLLLFIIIIANPLYAQHTDSYFNARLKTIDSNFFAKDFDTYKTELWQTAKQAENKKDTFYLLKTQRRLFKYYIQDAPNVDSAAHYYKKAQYFFKTYSNDELQSKFDYWQAVFLTGKSEFQQAYTLFNRIENTIVDNNYSFLPHYYSDFARLHFNLGELDLAFEKLKKAAAIYTQRKELQNTSSIYNNLGILYKNKQQLDSSLVYYNKALEISLQLKDTIGIAYAYNNMGLVNYLDNKQQKALQYYEKALVINPKSPSKSLLNNYSEILIGLGNYIEAEQLLNDVKLNATQPIQKIDALAKLIKLKRVQKKYIEAIELQDSLIIAKEEYINTTKIKEIERLKAEYDTQQKAKEIQLLTQEKQKQQLINSQNKSLGFTILVLIFLLLIIAGLVLRNRLIKEKSNQLLLEQQLLRSQMNPHFIFNALSNIQTTILKNENEKAISYLSKFSKLVRNILENSKDTKITLAKEVETIKSYLDLQKIRFSESFTYTICIASDIEDELTYIPAMLFQPLVENAIEHGIEGIENGEITIDFKLKEHCIACTVLDNGIGLEPKIERNVPLEKKSMSTQIIKDRLAIFSKKKKYTFQFNSINLSQTDTNKGTKVYIELPILE